MKYNKRHTLLFPLLLLLLLICGCQTQVTETSDEIILTTKELHCLSWVDSGVSQYVMEYDIPELENRSLILDNIRCSDDSLAFETHVSQAEGNGTCGEIGNIWDSYMKNCGTFYYNVVQIGPNRKTCIVLNGETIVSEIVDENDQTIVSDAKCEWLSDDELKSLFS